MGRVWTHNVNGTNSTHNYNDNDDNNNNHNNSENNKWVQPVEAVIFYNILTPWL